MENTMLAGLWFGSTKPCPNLFLEAFRDELFQLLSEIDVEIPNSDVTHRVQEIVLCGTCDAPAKALFLNMKQYNGQYGCQKCKTEGKQKEGLRVYPYEDELDLRTDEKSGAFALQACEPPVEPVFGVKGPTLLHLFVYNIIRTTVVDSMHCVFLEIVKKLLSIWFDPSFHSHPAPLSKFIDLVNKRISEIAPPSFAKRLPSE